MKSACVLQRRMHLVGEPLPLLVFVVESDQHPRVWVIPHLGCCGFVERGDKVGFGDHLDRVMARLELVATPDLVLDVRFLVQNILKL